MEYIYYCPKCRNTYSAEEDGMLFERCPSCNTRIYPTHLTDEEWDTKTDDEKEEVKKSLDEKNAQRLQQTSTNSNTLGKIFSILGICVIILSVIGGVSIMSEESLMGIIAGLSGCLGGLILMGFGEIINLLQDIKNK